MVLLSLRLSRFSLLRDQSEFKLGGGVEEKMGGPEIFRRVGGGS